MKTSRKTIYTLATTFGLSLFSLAAASAWGPERPTFTMESPATYPTFNSITDNPTIGDERDFVRVGEINADVTDLKNEITIVPGRQYLVYVYFHNNASATYNDAAHNHSGVAVRTRMSTAFSTVVTPNEKGTISATITADNSNPGSVWDEAYMTTASDKVLLHYIPGSAKIYNDWNANGSVMPSSLFTYEGTLLGLNALNGVIPGCEEYHGVVTYVLQAEELGGSIDKTVSKDGTNYYESINLSAGEEAYFKLTIRNTGDIALTNATIRDSLPNGLTLVPGSVEFSANDSAVREQLSDNLIANGYNLGTIGTGNTVYIYYRAKAGDDFDCDGRELTNTASLTYDSDQTTGDTKEDAATVNVTKTDCSIPIVPITPEIIDPVKPDPEDPDDPEPTNPDDPGTPSEIVNTGPVEIVLAVIIVLSISFAGFYLYRTGYALHLTKKAVSGKSSKSDDAPAKTTDEPKDTK